MKREIALFLGAVMAASTVAMAGPAAAQASDVVEIENSYTWNIAMNVAETTLNYTQASKFKELIEERSGGKITINLFPGGQLGNDAEQIQGLVDGTMDFISTVTGGVGMASSAYCVFDQEFALSNLDQLHALETDEEFINWLDEAGQEQANAKLIGGLCDAGFRELTANKEINSMEDLSGIKIRMANSAFMINTWAALGTTPTVMDFGELYMGLQQKTVDAQENPYMNIVGNKLYEVQSYAIETNHSPHLITFVMNNRLYDSLPENVQELITSCATEATEYTRELSVEAIEEYKQTCVDNGMTIIELSDEALAEMKEAAMTVWPSIQEEIGEEACQMYLDACDRAAANS